jgi:type VI secretion system protein ImpA
MLRGLRWGELRAAGPEPDPAILEPPPTEVRQQLKSLARDGQWQEVLEAAETAMGTPCGRAWLDLQRYAVKACEELGSYYDPIATAIRSELRTLLADLPQLSQWTLTDDTPTANAETQAWLRTLVPAQPAVVDEFAAPPEPEEAAEEQGEEKVLDAYELAVQAARSGRAEEAIEILTHEAAQERSGRARFQRRVQLAQICLGARHEAIALPILEALVEEIERRELEEWEAGDMLAHPLALLYRSMNKLNLSAEEKQKVYSRICRLDPLQALACSK